MEQIKPIYNGVPLVSVEEAATKTGISQKRLREGCKNGTVPHLNIGRVIKINLPLLMQIIDEASASGGTI